MIAAAVCSASLSYNNNKTRSVTLETNAHNDGTQCKTLLTRSFRTAIAAEKNAPATEVVDAWPRYIGRQTHLPIITAMRNDGRNAKFNATLLTRSFRTAIAAGKSAPPIAGDRSGRRVVSIFGWQPSFFLFRLFYKSLKKYAYENGKCWPLRLSFLFHLLLHRVFF